MAIDTAAKRFSIMGMLACGTAPLLPPPSGTVDAPARFIFLDLYSGFVGAVVGSVSSYIPIYLPRRR